MFSPVFSAYSSGNALSNQFNFRDKQTHIFYSSPKRNASYKRFPFFAPASQPINVPPGSLGIQLISNFLKTADFFYFLFPRNYPAGKRSKRKSTKRRAKSRNLPSSTKRKRRKEVMGKKKAGETRPSWRACCGPCTKIFGLSPPTAPTSASVSIKPPRASSSPSSLRLCQNSSNPNSNLLPPMPHFTWASSSSFSAHSAWLWAVGWSNTSISLPKQFSFSSHLLPFSNYRK